MVKGARCNADDENRGYREDCEKDQKESKTEDKRDDVNARSSEAGPVLTR